MHLQSDRFILDYSHWSALSSPSSSELEPGQPDKYDKFLYR